MVLLQTNPKSPGFTRPRAAKAFATFEQLRLPLPLCCGRLQRNVLVVMGNTMGLVYLRAGQEGFFSRTTFMCLAWDLSILYKANHHFSSEFLETFLNSSP